MTNKVIPIRLSHSSLETLHECERKWQLDKLLANGTDREDSEHTVFGKAFGVGVAAYAVTQDADMALWQAWYSYWPEIETEKKNIPRLLSALMSSFIELDTLLMEYEVVEFNGKPAVELSFRLEVTDEYYFVGHIDLVLRNRFTGVHYVLDAKTTGLSILDLSPLYKHSGQTLGYSIALDRIVGAELSSYGVIYFVAQLGKDFKAKIHTLTYEKTLMDRLNWFITLGLDVKHLEEMAELNIYPKRHTACLHFMRPCREFGTCDLHALDTPKIRTEDNIAYDFSYKLEDLIADHMRRIPQSEMAEADDTIVELVE